MFRKKQETLHRFDSMRRTTCVGCPSGCGIKVFLEEGRIVEIFGDEEHPTNKGSLCPKGMLTHFHLANPNRVTEPRLRESISEPFRKATWDEAIAFVSEKLAKIASTNGTDSIYIHGLETDPPDFLAGATWFAGLLGTPNIPERFFPRPFTAEGEIKKMFGIPASMLLMNAPRDWCHSRCILVYGSDPAASDPMTFGPIIDARDRGSTVLVIDSRKTVTASKASFSIRVKPGSESIALKGILHVLLEKGLIDEEFLQESTEGFDRFKSELQGFTPQAVARSCWVTSEDIEHMADLIGRVKPVQVLAGDWNSRRSLSDEDLVLCSALVLARGSVGVPGGGVNLLSASPFLRQTLLKGNEDSPETSQEQRFSINLENLLLDQKGKIGALISRGNPYARLSGGGITKAAFSEIPLVVHLSSYPNETLNHAHVSFPMSSWLEHSGLVAANNGRAIQWHHKVVEQPGECRSPLEFWTDLARAIIPEEECPWRDEEGNADANKAGAFFLSKNPLTEAISVEELDPETQPPGGILWPCVDSADLEFEDSRFIKGNVRGRNILFQTRDSFPSGEGRFPTSSGKVIFSMSYPGQKNDQSVGTKSRYPLMLTTGVLVDTIGDYGYFVTDRRPGADAAIIKIHPRLGKLIGVSAGEKLTVESSEGALTAPAWLSDDVDPRSIWCPEDIDPCQPFFEFESPKALFGVPSIDSGSRKFAMVTVYKTGTDRERARESIIRFVEELDSEPLGK